MFFKPQIKVHTGRVLRQYAPRMGAAGRLFGKGLKGAATRPVWVQPGDYPAKGAKVQPRAPYGALRN